MTIVRVFECGEEVHILCHIVVVFISSCVVQPKTPTMKIINEKKEIIFIVDERDSSLLFWYMKL